MFLQLLARISVIYAADSSWLTGLAVTLLGFLKPWNSSAGLICHACGLHGLEVHLTLIFRLCMELATKCLRDPLVLEEIDESLSIQTGRSTVKLRLLCKRGLLGSLEILEMMD